MTELSALEARINRHRDGTNSHCAEDCRVVVAILCKQNSHLVARLDAVGKICAGEFVDSMVEIGKPPAHFWWYESLVGPCVGRTTQHVANGRHTDNR